MPYAIGLSLTVAYRSIRSPSIANPDQQKENLNTRSKMLESLEKYWWTADAMAKLGRKALKSMQNPVGVKRGEADMLASAMEAESTVCKYGPFETKERQPPKRQRLTDHNGNPLRLLSDAAATHSSATPHSTANYSSAPSRSTTACANSYPDPSSNTDNAYQRTPLSDSLQTPSATEMSMLPNGNTKNSNNAASAPTPSFDQSMFAKFDDFGHFPELDNMFDGFYDLSVPTITFDDSQFQSFWNNLDGGVVGAGGYDAVGYDPNAFTVAGGMTSGGFGGAASMAPDQQQQHKQQMGGMSSGEDGGVVRSEYPELGN